MRNMLNLTLAIMLTEVLFISPVVYATSENKYFFDPQLFKDKNVSRDLIKKLNDGNGALPGEYKLDIYINNNFLTNRKVNFIDYNNSVQPCFSNDFISELNINSDSLKKSDSKNCQILDNIVEASYAKLNLPNLRLDITIPQAKLQNRPKGYIPIQDLNSGESMAFLNYMANYYHVNNNKTSNQDSVYAFFNAGFNMGTWQYRQQSTVNYSKHNGSDWQNIRSYIQKPIPSFKGISRVGQLVTSGEIFSGLNFNGISFDTDERTLPLSQRGYAPVISGIAETTATVSVKQNGYEIYQITVPAGQFVINDLNSTSYNGDLDVEVKEANGTIKRFTVPFSAVSQSLRAGQSKVNFAFGETRDTGKKSIFSDIIYQLGISNSITLNTGTRIAEQYVALSSGGVLTNSLGAFGLQTVYTNTRVNDNDPKRLQGLRTSLSYSKTIQETDTTISLASYHYSTADYRDLSDVLALRNINNPTELDSSSTYQQKDRFDITLSQKVGDFGNLFISASRQNYRNGRSTNNQLQLGYNKVFDNNISLNVAVTKQNVSSSSYGNSRNETMTSIAISLPFGSSSSYNSSLGINYTYSKDMGSQTQASLSGQLGENSNTNYSLGINNIEESDSRSISGSLQKNFSKINVGLNASKGKNYWQAGSNIQGAVALHSEGITLGPYLSDTFALVEAKGAEGAHVLNAQNTTIDSNGYALIPTLTPYQYNSILIDPKGTDNTVEFLENEKRVAPYAGSAVKVSFNTQWGYPLLIKVKTEGNALIPLGTEVMDSSNNSIGMVGQNNQIYLRTKNLKDDIYISWKKSASAPSSRCTISYDATKLYDSSHAITKVNAGCN
ncbi:fimbrial biogenesis outer membrane usher protein [Providencia rettgeri]|uniref:fimbria/pilus outer membrane usher protein n=1 Tax=unclassified Providencia TaxID=2633465 RepID=UPI0023491A09|nr:MULTISPECIES: fimbria/pilus outer membrane usher protein [unclassified Providencia]EJD6475827.1 fimbrial biogenesis outer membrane usher protein [Providencia rettgeri]ELR5067552.1 fimbrial biogenesis outer membrane usher protein [Providencia rettgeri]ELR5164750.1 fimbrial biogenesis outer membrane usher protein [Providencia rettgeri]